MRLDEWKDWDDENPDVNTLKDVVKALLETTIALEQTMDREPDEPKETPKLSAQPAVAPQIYKAAVITSPTNPPPAADSIETNTGNDPPPAAGHNEADSQRNPPPAVGPVVGTSSRIIRRGTNEAVESTRTNSEEYRFLPKDSYSFIALHGSEKESTGLGLVLGLGAFVFQFVWTVSIMIGTVSPLINGEMKDNYDNPLKGMDFFSSFTPANAAIYVRFIQIFAAVSFAVIRNPSTEDVIRSIHDFRWKFKDCCPWRALSNFLRFSQGLLVSIAMIFIVMTESDAINIAISFTGVSYISQMDEIIFEMARDNWLGAEMKRIAQKLDDPDSICTIERSESESARRKNNENEISLGSYISGMGLILFVFIVIFAFIIPQQERISEWTTEEFRLHFDASTGLSEYNGCFERTGTRIHRRVAYKSSGKGQNVYFAYCRRNEHWRILKNFSLDEDDPCDLPKTSEIAHSSSTLTFDIVKAFDDTWLSPDNKPLPLSHVTMEDMVDKDLLCDRSEGDGICNPELNKFVFDYDDGDCCATTCVGENDSCGTKNISIFGGDNISSSYGFPNCKNPQMTDLVVTLQDFKYKDIVDSKFETVRKDNWEVFRRSFSSTLALLCTNKKIFAVILEEHMKGENYTANVNKNGDCSLAIKTFEPLSTIRVNASMPIPIITTNSIPTTIGNLTQPAFEMVRFFLCK